MIRYPIPPHLQPAYAVPGMCEGLLAISERIHREFLSLPLWPGLRQSNIEAVSTAVRAFADRVTSRAA